MITLIFTHQPSARRLLIHPLREGTESVTIIGKPVIQRCSEVITSFLKTSAMPHLQGPVCDGLVTYVRYILTQNCSIPKGMRISTEQSRLRAHWIVEPADLWHGHRCIPRSTDVVMSFKLDSVYITVSSDLAFFMANRIRDIYCDGWPRVKITGIWMATDVQSSTGFMTLANVGEDWFDVLRSSTAYEALSGWPDAFFCTWPLTDNYLREHDTLIETVSTARELARI